MLTNSPTHMSEHSRRLCIIAATAATATATTVATTPTQNRDIQHNKSFHISYYIIGGANLAAALITLLVPSPYRYRRTKVGTLPAAPPSAVGNIQDGGDGDGGSKSGSNNSGGSNCVSIATTSAAAVVPGSLVATGLTPDKGGTVAPMGWPPAGFFLFFIFYTAVELAISNWIASFSVLNGLQNEADAATLSSLYYGVFTGTRILAAPVAWCGVSSRTTLGFCLLFGMGSISALCKLSCPQQCIFLLPRQRPQLLPAAMPLTPSWYWY